MGGGVWNKGGGGGGGGGKEGKIKKRGGGGGGGGGGGERGGGGGGGLEKIQKLKIGEGTIIWYSRVPLKTVLIASCISFTFENGFD